jgi:hypothetical protein
MATITVYHYELFDPFSGNLIRSKMPATRRAIDAAGGSILPETAHEVDIEMVNEDGVVTHAPVQKKSN